MDQPLPILTPETPTSPEPADPAQATQAGRRVFLETFGCQMNVLDSELVTSQLRAMGYGFVSDWRAADVILYNTCSVREHAEQKITSRLGQVAPHKRHHPHKVVGVLGCMAEREGEKFVKRYPVVDVLCGPGELDKVPMLIDNAIKTRQHLQPIDEEAPPERRRGQERAQRTPAQVALQGNTHRRSGTLSAATDDLEMLDLSRAFSPEASNGSAYVRITRGCNKFCTYCVVPNTRGAEVHRPPANILEECRRLVAAGVVEITLLGQTVNHYHYQHDHAVTLDGVAQPQIGANVGAAGPKHAPGARVTTFAQLLAMIHDELPELKRLRFITSFPRDFGDDILQTMAERPRICRYFHLPVQSGSNAVLKRMNRGYTAEQYEDLINRIRRILPQAQIASDVICGFPGETEEDHRATAELMQRCAFKNCFIFKYSERPGTPAVGRLSDDVPEDVKRRRNNELLAIQADQSQAIHKGFVGRIVPVFLESVSVKAQKSANAADPRVSLGWEQPVQTTQLSGRTDGDLIVMVEADPALVGSIVDVRIESARPLTLFGRLADVPVEA